MPYFFKTCFDTKGNECPVTYPHIFRHGIKFAYEIAILYSKYLPDIPFQQIFDGDQYLSNFGKHIYPFLFFICVVYNARGSLLSVDKGYVR